MQLPVAKKSGGGGGDFKYLGTRSVYGEKGKKYILIYAHLSGASVVISGDKPGSRYGITGGATAGAAWVIYCCEGNDATITATINGGGMGIYTVE